MRPHPERRRPGDVAVPRSGARPHRGHGWCRTGRSRSPTDGRRCSRSRSGCSPTAVGCDPDEAALASAHGTAATLSAAGLRLLSLDPFDVAAVLHDLRPEVDGVADSTIGLAGRRRTCPHASTPFAEIDVELQSTLPTRLFRS